MSELAASFARKHHNGAVSLRQCNASALLRHVASVLTLASADDGNYDVVVLLRPSLSLEVLAIASSFPSLKLDPLVEESSPANPLLRLGSLFHLLLSHLLDHRLRRRFSSSTLHHLRFASRPR